MQDNDRLKVIHDNQQPEQSTCLREKVPPLYKECHPEDQVIGNI